MQKKRGAQPGNRNAYKFGFYSAAFRAAEQRLLSQMPTDDLTAEVELIRVTNLRLLEALNAAGASTDLATQLSALRALNLSIHSITSLLRVQALSADARQAAAELDQFLESQSQAPSRSSSAGGSAQGSGDPA